MPAAVPIMITIVLAEDHFAFRRRLRDLLSFESDCEIVGEAADGLQAVQLVNELHPDALVTDLSMPGLNGFEVISRVQLTGPETHIIMVSVKSEEPYVMEAFRRGAKGFVQKQFSGIHLIPALRTVVAGGCYLSPPSSAPCLAGARLDRANDTLDSLETLPS